MNFKEQYINSSLEELIHIIENAADYNPDCVAVVKEIIVEKEFTTDEISNAAKEINTKRIEEQLISFDVFNDKLIILTSTFLSQEEMKELYEIGMENIKSKREDLGFDVWSYAIGGV